MAASYSLTKISKPWQNTTKMHGWIPFGRSGKILDVLFGIRMNWHELQISVYTCIPMSQLFGTLNRVQGAANAWRKQDFPLGEPTALNRRLLVVTHRLCRSGYVDWRVQRRALSTTSLKIVHKYCRVTLCLSAALNLPSLTRQLCFGNVLPSLTQHTPWQAPYILVYCC